MFKTFLLFFALTSFFASVSYAQLGVGMKLGVPASDALVQHLQHQVLQHAPERAPHQLSKLVLR